MAFARTAALALLASCLWLPATSHAVTIAEGGGGLDVFPNQPGDPFNFIGPNDGTITLDPGLNIAEGLFACFEFACRDDFDSFRMVVPAGLQVVSTSLLVLNGDGTAEQLFVFPVGLFAVPADPLNDAWKAGNLIGLTDNITTINGAAPNVSTTVLLPGIYDVVPFNFLTLGGGGWHAEFTTAAYVPEPGTASLLGLGLVALAARRRER